MSTQKVKVIVKRKKMIETIKKYFPFMIVIVLLLCLSWLIPSYKKTVKDSSEKDQVIATLRKEIDSWKNVSSNRTTYYSNGRVKSTASTIVSSGTHSSESATESSIHSLTTHELTVTKRGLFHATAYWDFKNLSFQPKAYSADYNLGFFGPSAFIQPEPFIGMIGIGVYF